jgi:DNA-binding response OmpR family regulator
MTNEHPRILVVEDDDDTRRAMGMRLRVSGFRTLEATDTASAVATARAERPDLVLLDLGLPGGGGFAVLEALKADPGLGRMPIVVLSARDAHATRDRALAAGAYAYFEKLVDNDTLVEAIRAGLARRGDAA